MKCVTTVIGGLFNEEFANIEQLTDKQFTYDACCDDSATHSHCAAYSSTGNSFLALGTAEVMVL